MKLLMALIFSLNGVFAQSPAKSRGLLRPDRIVYNPDGNEPGRFIMSYKDYEDVRIDSDLDGKIDYWRVRKGPLYVETYFKNGEVDKYFVRKVGEFQTVEFHYVAQNGHLILQQARSRQAFGRTYTTLQELCADETSKKSVILKELKDRLEDEVFASAAENLLDESCTQLLSKNEHRKLQSNLATTLKDTAKNLRSCLKSPEFKKAFKIEEQDIFANIVEVNINLQSLQMVKNSEDLKSTIKCEDKEAKPFVPAITSEKGIITIFKDSKNGQEMAAGPKVLVHELLHRSGIFNEEMTAAISDFCNGKEVNVDKSRSDIKVNGYMDKSMARPKDMRSAQIISGNASAAIEDISKKEVAKKQSIAKTQAVSTRSPASIESSSTTGSQLAASTSTANIPASMTAAETAVPSSSTLSLSMSSPQPKTDVGAQRALTNSVSESRSVLSRANNLIGAMNTPAGATTLAEKSRSKIEAKIDTVEFKSRVGSERIAGSGRGLSADRLAAGDRVVEEITLDGSSSNNIPAARTVSASPNSAATSASPEQAAARVGTSAAQRGGRPSEMSASQPSGGSGGSAGSGSMASSPSIGGGGGGIPAARGIASVGETAVAPLGGNVAGGASQNTQTQQQQAQQAPAAAVNARETVISMFQSRGSYAATKNRLKDQSFTQQLQAQNITIMDLYGNSFGAAKGEVIFLDEGNRFVRQK